MIKKLFVLLIAIMGISQMNAQTVSLSILRGAKWEWTYPNMIEHRTATFQFTDTQMQEEIYFVKLGKRHVLKHRFYLTDEPVSHFNENMVGKAQSGKYLVHEFLNNRATSFEILSASNTQIKMKHPDGDIFVLTRR